MIKQICFIAILVVCMLGVSSVIMAEESESKLSDKMGQFKDSLDDGAPKTKISLCFDIHNVFQVWNMFTSFQGFSGGAMVHLSDSLALRIGGTFRTYLPRAEEGTTTFYVGSEQVNIDTEFNSPGYSYFEVEAGADMLLFLAEKRFSPYAGGGFLVDYTYYNREYTNNSNDYYDELYDRNIHFLEIGLRGLFGFKIAMNQRIAMYLEYMMDLTILDHFKSTERMITKDKIGAGNAQNEEVSVFGTSSLFDVNMRMSQGAAFGISFRI